MWTEFLTNQAELANITTEVDVRAELPDGPPVAALAGISPSGFKRCAVTTLFQPRFSSLWPKLKGASPDRADSYNRLCHERSIPVWSKNSICLNQ
jgi:hypothetical protein